MPIITDPPTIMASYAKHGALSAGTVVTVDLSIADGMIEVLNRTGDDEIYFTVGTTENAPLDPTVGGDDCYVVPAQITSRAIDMTPHGDAGAVDAEVKLLSAGTPSFSVLGGEGLT